MCDRRGTLKCAGLRARDMEELRWDNRNRGVHGPIDMSHSDLTENGNEREEYGERVVPDRTRLP